MKRIVLFLTSFLFLACVNTTSQEQKEDNEEQEHNSATNLQLNNGAKWKADSTTLGNVSAITQLVNDSNYRNEKSRAEFSSQLQKCLDSLISQCKMSGREHEVLHSWLKPVLHDVKEMKEDEGEYGKNYAKLRQDVQRFYDYFE